MRPNERVEKAVLISEVFSKIVRYYRSPPLSPDQMDMYVEDLMELTIEEIVTAIKIYRSNPKNERYPLPAQLKALIVPSAEAQARDAVSRINLALVKYSGDYDSHIQRAKEFIGELGWLVVERNGGWGRMVRMSHDELGPNAQAQWRELAIALQTKSQVGELDVAPSLPQSKKPGLIQLGDFLKQIEQKNGDSK